MTKIYLLLLIFFVGSLFANNCFKLQTCQECSTVSSCMYTTLQNRTNLCIPKNKFPLYRIRYSFMDANACKRLERLEESRLKKTISTTLHQLEQRISDVKTVEATHLVSRNQKPTTSIPRSATENYNKTVKQTPEIKQQLPSSTEKIEDKEISIASSKANKTGKKSSHSSNTIMFVPTPSQPTFFLTSTPVHGSLNLNTKVKPSRTLGGNKTRLTGLIQKDTSTSPSSIWIPSNKDQMSQEQDIKNNFKQRFTHSPLITSTVLPFLTSFSNSQVLSQSNHTTLPPTTQNSSVFNQDFSGNSFSTSTVKPKTFFSLQTAFNFSSGEKFMVKSPDPLTFEVDKDATCVLFKPHTSSDFTCKGWKWTVEFRLTYVMCKALKLTEIHIYLMGSIKLAEAQQLLDWARLNPMSSRAADCAIVMFQNKNCRKRLSA